MHRILGHALEGVGVKNCRVASDRKGEGVSGVALPPDPGVIIGNVLEDAKVELHSVSHHRGSQYNFKQTNE